MDSAVILKYGVNGTRAVINTITAGEPVYNYKQILDPLSSIIRLALLNFKGKGCKISISNNKIYFQPPNIFQGPVRWTYGDNRNDLHNLCNPIEKAANWYDPKTNADIEHIFEHAVIGLDKLKESYISKDNKLGDSNLVCHSITHYVDILNNRLKNDETPIIKNDHDMNSLKYLWNKSEISVINNLLDIATEKRDKNEDAHYTLNAIESILEGKDRAVRNLVEKLNNSV